MEALSTKSETLNKFKIQSSNILNIRTLEFSACLVFRNSHLGFNSGRSI
jgi:hypothetical protein